MAGDAVHAALAAGDTSASSFSAYTERALKHVEAMRSLVHAFYDTSFSFGEFFRAHPEMRPEVTDVLIGKLDKDFSALLQAMKEFARIPPPLEHGRPLVRERPPAR